MTNFVKLNRLTPAEEKAVAYRKLRYAADVPPADPPTLHPDNALLPDEIDDDKNQLPFQFQGAALKVQIHSFEAASAPGNIPGIITLRFDGSELPATAFPFTTPVAPADFPFNVTLPAGLTDKPGRHELSYIINHDGNDGAEVTPLFIHVDRESPPPVEPTTTVSEITKDQLPVAVTCPLTNANKIGDRIRLWYGSSISDALLVDSVNLKDPVTAPVFQLTESMLGGVEGIRALWTDHADRKGNQSAPSDFLRLEVILTDPPVLEPAFVPLFSDDDVISLADAQTQGGLGVCISKEFPGYVEGSDYMQITFDGNIQPEKLITAFPCYIDVPFRDVYNGVAYQDDVPVGLQVRRGNRLHPATGPIVTLVKKDLRRPGVIDPENPGPPDPTLPLVTLKGAVTPDYNKLRKEDAGQAATMTAPLHPHAKQGERYEAFYSGVAISASEGGVYTVLGTEPPGFEVPFSVPWDMVEKAGNNSATPAHYLIYDAVSNNYAQSLPTEVDVYINELVVPDPVFQHLDVNFGNLNCKSIRRVSGQLVIVVLIPADPQLADKEIELVYQAYSDAAGLVPIPGVTVSVLRTITSDEALKGAYVNIPFEKFNETARNHGAVEYKVTVDGIEATSERHLVRVNMREGNGSACVVP